MAEKVLYGHSSGANGTGYRILSRSACDNPVSDLDVNALIQKLKLRPATLGEHMGWYWLPFSDQARVLAAALVCTSENGVQTLQFRLVFFGLDECDRFHWQPFHFLAEMRSQTRWEVGGDGVLPGLVQGLPVEPSVAHTNPFESFAIDWKDSATVADRVLAAFLFSCPLKDRPRIEFLAPELSDRNNPLIVYRAGSSPGLSSARNESDVSSQRTFDLKTAVLSGGIALLLGFAMSYAFLKTKLEEKDALLADRESELRQYEDSSALPISTPAVLDPSNTSSNQSDEFAKSTMAQLRTLFGELYSESLSAVSVDQETARLLHYLDNKGASNDYSGLLASGLEKWIEIEERRNSEQDRIAEQDRAAKQLHETLLELRNLVDDVNRRSLPRSVTAPSREKTERETAEEINATIAKIGELVETLRELTNRSINGVDSTSVEKTQTR